MSRNRAQSVLITAEAREVLLAEAERLGVTPRSIVDSLIFRFIPEVDGRALRGTTYERVLQLVEKRPGLSCRELAERLGGKTTAWMRKVARTLEADGLVETCMVHDPSRPGGGPRRVYPVGQCPRYRPLSADLLTFVRAHPGALMAEAAAHLGCSLSFAHKLARKLATAGEIDLRRDRTRRKGLGGGPPLALRPVIDGVIVEPTCAEMEPPTPAPLTTEGAPALPRSKYRHCDAPVLPRRRKLPPHTGTAESLVEYQGRRGKVRRLPAPWEMGGLEIPQSAPLKERKNAKRAQGDSHAA